MSKSAVTAKTVTDEQIRAERRLDPSLLDLLMVAIHSTDHEFRASARQDFADIINARNGAKP